MNNENWKTVRLGDIFDLQMGKTPDRKKLDYFQGSHKWISIADISKSEKYISETKECLSDEAITSSGIKSIPKDTLIMSFKLSIGKTAITSDEMYSNEAIMAFLPNGKCETDNSFLYHLFSNKDWSEGSNKAVKGITLNKASLSEAKIPLPPLATQKHIATVLDKCTEVIKKHKLMLEKYDTLIKSRFIEMFGDPVQNPMGWRKKLLSETAVIITGNTPSRADKNNYGTYLEWIKTDNITSNTFITTASEYLSEEGAKKARIVDIGSILMACIAGSLKSIGKVALTDRKVAFNQQINAVIPKSYNSLFLYCLFKLSKTYIENAVDIMLKGILSKGKLEKLEFILPPLALQEKFASFVQAVDAQKAKAQKSLEKAEILYKALMQRYFA